VIKEGMDHWRDNVHKVGLVSSEEASNSKNDAYKCLTILKSMCCPHNDSIFDDDYICHCYPIEIALQNHGYLCLVAKAFLYWASL